MNLRCAYERNSVQRGGGARNGADNVDEIMYLCRVDAPNYYVPYNSFFKQVGWTVGHSNSFIFHTEDNTILILGVFVSLQYKKRFL